MKTLLYVNQHGTSSFLSLPADGTVSQRDNVHGTQQSVLWVSCADVPAMQYGPALAQQPFDLSKIGVSADVCSANDQAIFNNCAKISDKIGKILMA